MRQCNTRIAVTLLMVLTTHLAEACVTAHGSTITTCMHDTSSVRIFSSVQDLSGESWIKLLLLCTHLVDGLGYRFAAYQGPHDMANSMNTCELQVVDHFPSSPLRASKNPAFVLVRDSGRSTSKNQFLISTSESKGLRLSASNTPTQESTVKQTNLFAVFYLLAL